MLLCESMTKKGGVARQKLGSFINMPKIQIIEAKSRFPF
jgi:hypothetical protein